MGHDGLSDENGELIPYLGENFVFKLVAKSKEAGDNEGKLYLSNQRLVWLGYRKGGMKFASTGNIVLSLAATAVKSAINKAKKYDIELVVGINRILNVWMDALILKILVNTGNPGENPEYYHFELSNPTVLRNAYQAIISIVKGDASTTINTTNETQPVVTSQSINIKLLHSITKLNQIEYELRNELGEFSELENLFRVYIENHDETNVEELLLRIELGEFNEKELIEKLRLMN